ncbi:MAG: hypothetical protein KGL43_00935, partial [Burkholderiales bacterium]|nr:hypothetical protein [Burkholderiales bacterium]
MDFLRRLHAAQAEAPGQARADLGSRFAPRLAAGAIGTVAAEDAWTVAGAMTATGREASRARIEPASPSSRSEAALRAADLQAPLRDIALEAEVAQRAPSRNANGSAMAAASATTGTALPSALSHEAHPARATTVPQRPFAAPEAMSSADFAAPPSNSAPARGPVRASFAMPLPASPRPALPRAPFASRTPARPLRASVLPNAASAAPPVIQVTIDRIDVR